MAYIVAFKVYKLLFLFPLQICTLQSIMSFLANIGIFIILLFYCYDLFVYCNFFKCRILYNLFSQRKYCIIRNKCSNVDIDYTLYYVLLYYILLYYIILYYFLYSLIFLYVTYYIFVKFHMSR